MRAKRAGKDISAVISERTEVERAFALAFEDAVRRHRATGVPMVMWKDGKTVRMNPFDVPIPGENGELGRDGGG